MPKSRNLQEIEYALKFKLQRVMTGRNKEMEAIKIQFDAVLDGHSASTIIAGDIGVGKTVLVKAALADLSKLSGTCVYGKFEQYKDEEPYIAIMQIIENITNHMLTLPVEKLGRIKKELKKELGKDGALITEIVPQTQRVIGRQRKVNVADYQKLKIRLEKAFHTFITITAKELYPLVVAIDDLQWADKPSREIIKSICNPLSEHVLYLILVYRNNLEEYRVGMKPMLDNLAMNEYLLEVELDSLAIEATEAMLRYIFDGDIENVGKVIRLIHRRTMGNPLYIKQLINLLLENGEMYFDLKMRVWSLKFEKTSAFDLQGRIEDIVRRKIAGLDSLTKDFLEILACVGNRFSIKLLETATNYERGFIKEKLKTLCSAGLFIEIPASSEEGRTGEFEFCHDRVYEDVHEQINPERKEQLHYDIAMQLLSQPDRVYIEDNILAITSHLLNCKKVIERKGAGDRLIADLYFAGIKAKQSAAVEHALKLLTLCEELLGDLCWRQDYDSTLRIKLELAQCEFICGLYDVSRAHFEEMLAHAASQQDLVEIKKRYMILNSYTGNYDMVLDLGLQALNHLGFNIKTQGLQIQIVKEILFGKIMFRNSRLESIKNAPIVNDKSIINALEILTIMAASANLTNEKLFALIVLKISNLSARHGNSLYSPLGYAGYSLILGSVLGNFKKAKKIEKISLFLTELIDDNALKCTIYFVIGTFIDHWTSPAGKSFNYLQKSFDCGIQSGEFFYGGFTITSMIEMKYSMGEPLKELEKFLKLHQEYGKKMNHDVLLRLIKIFTDHINMLTILDFSPENRLIGNEEISKLDTIEGMTYYLLKMQRLFLEGKIEEAFCLSQNTIKQLNSVIGYFLQVDFVFYFLLLSLEIRKHQKGYSGRRDEKTFNKYRKKLQNWAELSPDNHNGKHLLIEALYRSLNNQQQDAARLYDAAIEHAKENHNLLLGALGNYLAARYYSNNKKIAKVYARDSCRLFEEWGSEKTANRIGMLFEIDDDFTVSEAAAAGTTGEIPDNTVPVRKTSFEQRLQEYQKELEVLELEGAYQYFLDTICAEAGADSGAILLEKEDQIKLKYVWPNGQEAFGCPADVDMEQVECLPKKVLRYASRTYEEVIIEAKPAEGVFAGDDYIRAREGISIICLPLKYKGIFAGLIYLESQTDHRFDTVIVGYIKRLSFFLVAKQALEKGPEKSVKVFTNEAVNDKLTAREAEVLYYMAQGMSNKEIGEKLIISSSTVTTHTKSIYRKLEVSSRVKAVIKAKALRLV